MSLKLHISTWGLKYKKLLRENTLYDHELQAATLYDNFAPVILGIQVVPVILPPPHLVYLSRLYSKLVKQGECRLRSD